MCLALALLMTVACFATCGGGDETTVPKATGTEDESGRNAVKDDVPTNLKFDGEKVVFFVSDSTEMKKNEMDVDKTTNNTLYDAVYYRNATVEQRLGVTIEQIGQPGTLGYYDSWNSTLRNAVLTKTGDYDSAAIHSSQGSVMAIEGIYYNILDIPYINFEKPWWNKSIHEELTVFNTLYYLAGDICATETQYGVCLFFNKDLFNEFYTTQNINLYSMVEEQK